MSPEQRVDYVLWIVTVIVLAILGAKVVAYLLGYYS